MVARRPGFREAARFWGWLGLVNFGGPAAQIALMHRELVERRQWIDEALFRRALAFCMALPGPEAQQLATYLGWYLHGIRGGVLAGVAFIAPSIGVMLGLSWMAAAGEGVPAVGGILFGLLAAVLGLVADAIVRLGARLRGRASHGAIAAAAFVALVTGVATFPLVVACAAVAGIALARLGATTTSPARGPDASEHLAVGGTGREVAATTGGIARLLRVGGAIVATWAVPMAIVGAWRGRDDILFQIGAFFTQAGFVTFGGAYAVLAYVADETVTRLHWLDAARMAQGLGLAESTPGPLIMVTQFVGFIAAWNAPGDLPRGVAATLGALMATWGTFLPGFLLVLAGAPWVERVARDRTVAAALDGIGAAVVGVIASLASFLAAHVLLGTTAPGAAFAIVVGAATFLAVRFGKVPAYYVTPAGAACGAAWSLAFPALPVG